MRRLRILIVAISLMALGGLSGCGLVARVQLQVPEATTSEVGRERFEEVVARLRRHNDGCYASRISSYGVEVNNLAALAVKFSMLPPEKSIETALTLDWETGEVRAVVEEPGERLYTDLGARCYQQMRDTLEQVYGEAGVKVTEMCKGGSCTRRR